MSCTECCHCCHVPPEGTTRAQVRLANDLAAIAGVRPQYTRGKYRPYAYIGDRHIKTPSGSNVKAHVWREELTFDDSHRMVSIDATLTAEDALAMFGALWKQKSEKPKRKRRRK